MAMCVSGRKNIEYMSYLWFNVSNEIINLNFII